MEKKKILFAYASYGSGHKAVANYIKNYFETVDKNYELKVIDFSDYSNFIGKTGEKLFDLNFKFGGSFIFSMVYKFFDHDISTIPYKEVTNRLFNRKSLRKEISAFNPDLTISTHFFPSILISDFNNKGFINTKNVTVITDYKSHKLWVKNIKNIDALVVGNDIVKNDLVKDGIDKSKIYSFGIPLSENFKNNFVSREETLRKYKLSDKKMTILFFGGGAIGSLLTYDYLKRILKDICLDNIQIVFVSGNNEKLRIKCERLTKKYQNIKILGYTNDVNNLLNICDFVITKPGAITATECIEMKKPMLLIRGAGGQENDNTKFLCNKGYAIKCSTQKKLTKNITKIIKNPQILEKMKKHFSKQSSNTANKKIYKLVKKILKSS